MKTFRKLLCIVLALMMVVPCFAYSVSAADHTSEADTLKDLGLFKGTDKGYELDRVPTRAEAAVMLVRFLGKEEAALKLKWSAPFTDVPDWAKPYVQYLYTEGLTSGTSATKYSPNNDCTAQQYATFMLRALGYKDGKEIDGGKEGITDPRADVSRLGNVTYISMDLTKTNYNDIPVKSSIIDIWPADSAHDVGHLFETGKDYSALYDAVVSTSNNETIETHTTLHTAGTDSVYIFNGKPDDKDFGQKVFINLYEGFGAVLGITDANPFGSYNTLVMLSGFWRKKADVSIPEGYYTFIVYGKDGSTVGFTEYIVQNALEAQFNKSYANGGPKKADKLKAYGNLAEANKYDFTYEEAVSYARQKNLVTNKNCNEKKFLRDHMVSISYTALSLPTADGVYRSLISKLMDEGAVTRDQANKFMGVYVSESEYLEKYGDFDAMNDWLDKNILSADTPPVYFTYGTKKSTEMKWTKSVGKTVKVIDYPDTDSPAERSYKEITYTNSADELKIVLTLTSYPDYPVVEYGAVLTNTGKNNSKTVSQFSGINATVTTTSKTTTLHYNRGSANEFEDYTPYTKKLGSGESINLFTEKGFPTNGYLPYFNAENTSDKNGVIAAVNWQGNWFAKYSVDNGSVTLNAGQNGANFAMLAGESFKVPGVVLMFYKNGDWQEGQNIWRRWIIEHNLMRNTGRRDFKENVYLCSGIKGASYDLAAIKNLKNTTLAKEYNSVFILDAGWYDCGDSWWYTGNYTPNSTYSGNSLKEISKACKDVGIDFCLWMEPERFFVDKPEGQALGGENYLTDGTGMAIINYGKKAAQDYAVDLINGVVKEYGLTVYRQDFNTNPEPFWTIGDKNETSKYGIARDGATENHACEGYINVWTRVEELNPGLVFDSCSGGGRRNDLETVRFSFAHTKSDYYADPVSQQCQNFGLLSWQIFTGTAFTGGKYADKYDLRTRLTLSIATGPDASSIYMNALKEWRENNKYMYCDYYQLSSFDNSESGKLAMQFNDYESGEGMMIAYLRSGGKYTFKAHGLNENLTYSVYDKDAKDVVVSMTGKELMTKGFTVSYANGKQAAPVVFYEVEY